MESRRIFLSKTATSLAVSVSMAGCSDLGVGPPGYVPVIFENRTDQTRMVSGTITSVPDEQSGYMNYFNEVVQVRPGESEKFEEGLQKQDYDPEVLGMATIENGTSLAEKFRFSFDLTEVRFVVESSESIIIETDEE